MTAATEGRKWARANLTIDLTCCLNPDIQRADEGGNNMFFVQCANCRTAARLVDRKPA